MAKTASAKDVGALTFEGNRASGGQSAVLKECLHLIENFLIDKLTGNITLNIKDGRILGLRAERLYDLKSRL